MAHPLDQGRDRFRSLVKNTLPAEPRLPLVHSTDVYGIANIIDDKNKIKTQECDVFAPERLTYLFYGRPVYRPNSSEQPTELEHYFPVCLIFKVDAPITIKRIFPFDSGAFHRSMYNSFLHRDMRLGDFTLEADSDTPGRVVRHFFTDNTNYIAGQRKLSESIDPSQLEAASYEKIISFQGANSLDSRGGGIEVQTDEALDLSRHVEAVILPSSQARAQVGNHLKRLGIDIIPYRTLGRTRPSEFSSKIYDICVDYLCRKKFVEEGRL